MRRQPVGGLLLEVTRFRVGVSLVGEQSHDVARIVMVEDAHKLAKVDVRHALVTADDEHVSRRRQKQNRYERFQPEELSRRVIEAKTSKMCQCKT